MMHVFMGCDTVSAFTGKDKLKAIIVLKVVEEEKQAFTELNENWEVKNELFQQLERFTCLWYST